MRLEFLSDNEPITLDAEPDGDGLRVRLPDGAERSIVTRRLPDDSLQITEAGRAFRVAMAKTERGIEISYQGQSYQFTQATGRKSGGRQGKSSGALTAPMVGVVADVFVEEGQIVAAYQPLAVVEAMKVMASLDAPFAGTVRKVHVAKGQRVAHGETLVEIEEAKEAAL